MPDIVAPGLRVLFCGINPGLMSARTGHHFAHPGNRFWPALHRSGFTPRQLRPDEQTELLDYRLGITNIAARPTAKASDLTRSELITGGQALTQKVLDLEPDYLAIVGITAYRTAFANPHATLGPQTHQIGRTNLWILPNPSGLNAHYQLDDLTHEFTQLRKATET